MPFKFNNPFAYCKKGKTAAVPLPVRLLRRNNEMPTKVDIDRFQLEVPALGSPFLASACFEVRTAPDALDLAPVGHNNKNDALVAGSRFLEGADSDAGDNDQDIDYCESIISELIRSSRSSVISDQFEFSSYETRSIIASRRSSICSSVSSVAHVEVKPVDVCRPDSCLDPFMWLAPKPVEVLRRESGCLDPCLYFENGLLTLSPPALASPVMLASSPTTDYFSSSFVSLPTTPGLSPSNTVSTVDSLDSAILSPRPSLHRFSIHRTPSVRVRHRLWELSLASCQTCLSAADSDKTVTQSRCGSIRTIRPRPRAIRRAGRNFV